MRFNLQSGGFFIDGGTPFNPPQAQTMPSHYDHPARIMAAEAQIASLKDALREALERWTELHSDFVDEDKVPNRVQQLRAQFLGDQPTK